MNEEWRERAACRGMDTEAFFPAQGEHHLAREARNICAPCPVRKECLQYAIDQRIREGVFGGMTENDRRRGRRKRAS